MEIAPITPAEARRRLSAQVGRIGNQALAARAWGVTPGLIVHVLKGRQQMGPKLAKAIGLRRRRYIVTRYEEACG